MELVGRPGQGEHHHLERHHHGEHTQVVHDLADQTAHAGHIPRRHGRTQQDQRRGHQRHEQAVEHRLDERIVAEGHALDIVLQAHEALLVGEGERLCVHGGVALEGVHQHDQDGQHIDNADHRKGHGQRGFAVFMLFGKTGFHYCCTSFLRVDWSWIRLMAATRIKKITALAWPTPRLLPPPE